MGLVADRKIAGPGGVDRVEVKLEDVLARAALQPERPRSDASLDDAPQKAGTVVIPVDDLEALFSRMVDAERRAERAEAQVESLRGQARYTFGQLTELRRQLQDCAAQVDLPRTPAKGPPGATVVRPAPVARTAAPVAPAPVGPVAPVRSEPAGGRRPAAVPDARNMLFDGDARPVARVSTNRHGERQPAGARPPSRPDVVRSGEAEASRRLEELAGRLRSIYSRLDEYRREPVITPIAERQRQRDLMAYDRELLAACAALGIPTDMASGAPVTVDARAALTRALNRAGLDVRTDVRQPVAQRPRRPPPSRRP